MFLHQHACLCTLGIVAVWRVWRPNAFENTIFGPNKLDMYLPKNETEIRTPQLLFKQAKWTKSSKMRNVFFQKFEVGDRKKLVCSRLDALPSSPAANPSSQRNWPAGQAIKKPRAQMLLTHRHFFEPTCVSLHQRYSRCLACMAVECIRKYNGFWTQKT